MNGLIALVGAGEYLPVMDDVDGYLLAVVKANGRAPRVICLATAAGQEGEANVRRWLTMGKEHFEALGAVVRGLPIVDRESADDPQYESDLEQADLIYFSGGDPIYLYRTMAGSRAWVAAQKAWARGAVYAGCSAGAMILGRRMPNFRRIGMGGIDGFGIVPADYVLPHFDRTGPFKHLVSLLRRGMKDGQWMLGIDENTALVGRVDGEWKVMGSSRVHILSRKIERTLANGETVPISEEGAS
jgi:cyanophycinase